MQRSKLLPILLCVAGIGLLGAALMLSLETADTSVAMNPPESAVQPADRDLVAQRLIELPADGKTYEAVLVVHDDWARRPDETALVRHWQSLPEVQDITADIRMQIFTESDPMTRARFAQHVKILPTVMILRPDGYTVFKDYGEYLQIPRHVGRWPNRPVVLPWNRVCPCPKPEPPRPPQPTPIVVPERVPDRVTPARGNEFVVAMLVACGLAALMAGLGTLTVFAVKRVHAGESLK
jgi:hypothetical protein